MNRSLTVAPTPEVADEISEVVETMPSLARTFTVVEIKALIDALVKGYILEPWLLPDQRERT